MRFITAAAISKRTVTMLAVVILLAGGVYVYNSLRVELFPDIEFPLVAVNTSYPSVDPEGVVEDVTSPLKRLSPGWMGLNRSSRPASRAIPSCWRTSSSGPIWPMRKAISSLP